jgi:hypothetical protein
MRSSLRREHLTRGGAGTHDPTSPRESWLGAPRAREGSKNRLAGRPAAARRAPPAAGFHSDRTLYDFFHVATYVRLVTENYRMIRLTYYDKSWIARDRKMGDQPGRHFRDESGARTRVSAPIAAGSRSNRGQRILALKLRTGGPSDPDPHRPPVLVAYWATRRALEAERADPLPAPR